MALTRVRRRDVMVRAVLSIALVALSACAGRSSRPGDAGPTDAAPSAPDATEALDASPPDDPRDWSDAASPEERDPFDASVIDAGSDDDEERSVELAPPCERPELEPALDVSSPASFLRGGFPTGGERLLHAVVPDGARDRVDVLHSTQTASGTGPIRWRIARATSAGELLEPVTVDDFPSEVPAYGGATRARDGALVVAWRGARWSRSLGTEAFVGILDSADASMLEGPTMHRSAPAIGVADSAPIVLGDREVLVSTVPEGIVASEIGRAGRLVVPMTVEPAGPSRVTVFDDERFAVTWTGSIEDARFRAHVAIASLDGAAVTRVVFSPGDYTMREAALAVYDGDIWVARFERRVDALEQSVLRIAHLDESLTRVERDRWLVGWGGLTPANLELLVFEGRLWIVWASLDARYGAAPVVHVSPLPVLACGREVGAAAIVLPTSWTGLLDVAAGASRDRIWVAVGSAFPANEARIYALTPVE